LSDGFFRLDCAQKFGMLLAMQITIQLLLGLVSGCLFIALARGLGRERELRLYAAGLFIAALIYLGFALSGATPLWLALELGGLVLFALLALLGLKISASILAPGWALHAAWDVGLHKLLDVVFVPDWYLFVCAGFDLLLAGYIAVRFTGRRAGQSLREAVSASEAFPPDR
jgi:hypothetical protein